MKKTMTSRAAMLCAGALLAAAGTAQAALQDRDLDGDSVVDAFYDTDLDITWLRDADLNGRMRWDNAVAWADDFSFAGYDDWRLPISDECNGYDCAGSEMGHLWYIELGNTAGSMTNTGDFQNLRSSLYWSGTENPPVPTSAMGFHALYGLQSSYGKNNAFHALTVRDGDAPVIPEPQTHALMLAGLGALAHAARRRPRG